MNALKTVDTLNMTVQFLQTLLPAPIEWEQGKLVHMLLQWEFLRHVAVGYLANTKHGEMKNKQYL